LVLTLLAALLQSDCDALKVRLQEQFEADLLRARQDMEASFAAHAQELKPPPPTGPTEGEMRMQLKLELEAQLYVVVCCCCCCCSGLAAAAVLGLC
jgi:hypothetical protein